MQGPYVVFEDVAGDEGLVDARVLVCPEMLQRIFRDALMPCGFCEWVVSKSRERRPREAAYLCSAALWVL
jgi:hypothetical protein